MARRLQLQALLEDLLESENVYFQPPENVVMVYPCIVYQRDSSKVVHADNVKYRRVQRYQLTYIDRKPDSPVVEKLGLLPMCTDVRSFASEGLNHDVFELYH